MKPFRKHYLLICGIPILLLVCVGIYGGVRKYQQPVDTGTIIGNFWFPPLSSNWSKRVYKSSGFESLTYRKKVNDTSTIFVMIWYCPPATGSQTTTADMIAMLRRSEKVPIGKKILMYDSHETRYHSWPALVSHEKYITEPIYVKSTPGYNGVYGKDDSNIRVDHTTMYILRPSDWYSLDVSLRGQDSAEGQAVKKSVWQLITQKMRYLQDNDAHTLRH